jgi:hypothetical protein
MFPEIELCFDLAEVTVPESFHYLDSHLSFPADISRRG